METIHIRNPKEFNQKLEKIKKSGSKSFHVVSDFDNTLTPAFINGEKYQSSIAQIRQGGYLTKDYPPRAFTLYEKYHPFEIDKTLSEKEKNKKMVEWWGSHIKLLVESGLNREVVDDILDKRKIPARGGAPEFYDLLKKHQVPLLIFSAGVGDFIQGSLEQQGKLSDNIHIISNFFDYRADGTVKGYKSDIIHTFNKDESQVKNYPYFDTIKQRKNVLLLGDGFGDLDMVAGMEHDVVVKIGFLNDHVKETFDRYSEGYDVVITEDGPMDMINDLLKRVLE